MHQLAYDRTTAEIQRILCPIKNASLDGWSLACQEIRTQTYTATVFTEALATALMSNVPLLNIKKIIKKKKGGNTKGYSCTYLLLSFKICLKVLYVQEHKKHFSAEHFELP